MKTKYTPGPWKIKKISKEEWQINSDLRDECLFQITPPFNEINLSVEDKANARLITAAPDLLEALKQLVSVAIGTEHGREFKYQVDIGVDAIAKATGEKT